MGLRLFHEYGDDRGAIAGVVYYLGGGFLELSASRSRPDGGFTRLWLQVPDVRAEEARLRGLGVALASGAERKPWGLVELRLHDPDGEEIILVEVPEDHFLRRQL